MPLVGSDFLSQFITVINFPTDEMLIIPNEDFYLKDNLFSIGMNLDVSEKGEIVVEGIWEKSPAEKAGIKVGERIVSFNSKKAGLDNVLEFQEVLMDDTIKIINIEVVDAGKIRSVVLEKTWLF
jgi:S1-C subfamily serine protease